MPPITRKFVFDKATGKAVELDESQMQSNCIKKLPQWPMVAGMSMGIDPVDIPKAQAILKQSGVSTEYTKHGDPILTSALHRKKHAEAMGFYDRNGGYGAARRKNG